MSHQPAARAWVRVAVAGVAGTLIATAVALLWVLLSITDPANGSAAGYLPLAWAATATLLVVFLVALFVRRVEVNTGRGFPLLVGGLSFVASFVPWWGLAGANPDLGTLIYRGLRVPQGIVQFWDLSLVMLSVDCSRWGFDIYQDNNGCMQDASIYAPGMVWLQYVPGGVFSQTNVQVLGVGMIVISSLVLAWLARQATGIGRIVLLVAAVGGPWLLLLERGNIDAVVLWAAALVVLLVRRWNTLTVWSMAAVIVWFMGTWKYYPFALGLMLIPVLRLHRGWVVLAGFAAATLAYLIATWENLLFSLGSNTDMIDYGDFVVLGRVPVVARMLGTNVEAGGWQFGDVLILAIAAFAVVAGFAIGRLANIKRPWFAMLAAGGSAMYLISVVVAGFGYGYKATFLLLAVPLLSRLPGSRMRIVAASGIAALMLIALQSVVVWNTVMVTTAGVIGAGFALGLAAAVIVAGTNVRPAQRSLQPQP